MFKNDFFLCVKQVQFKCVSSQAQVNNPDYNILNTVNHQN